MPALAARLTGRVLFHYITAKENTMKITRFVLSFFILLSLIMIVFPLTHRASQAAEETFYYDFIDHAAEASWSSGDGSLSFPGSTDDSRGFACYRDGIKLEDSVTYGRVLETHPNWDAHGHIQGTYPEMTIMSGTELVIWVGFLEGAEGTDGVHFQVNFRFWSGDTYVTTAVASLTAYYDGHLNFERVSLDSYAGKTGRFTIYAGAGPSSGKDWAVWAQAEIRPVDGPVLILTECPLPDAARGEAYSVRLEAIGGEVPPYHWAIINGSLPPGLNLNSDAGTISGTPTGTGTYSFRLRVCDSTELDGARCSEPKDCYIQVTEPGEPPTPPQAFDFGLGVSPAEITINLDPLISGATCTVEAQTMATISLVSGIAETVDLSLSGVPSHISSYCLPRDGLPSFTSECGFIVYCTGSLPAAGDYTVTLTATGGGITRTRTIRLHIVRGVYGDLDITSVEPVQVVYGAPLVAGKGTVFRVRAHSTFSQPVETELRLILPDDEWDIGLPYVPVRTLPLDWEYPEFWGPVTIDPGDNEIMLPIVPAGQENADFDSTLNPAGIIRGTCRGAELVWCHTDNRVVPRPIGDSMVTFTVEVDPRNVVSETNERNNEWYGGAAVVTTKAWSFLFVPYRSGASGCTPHPDFVNLGAQRQTEYLLAMFPIADSKITYAYNPYTTDWEDREGYAGYESRGTFLARIARLARSEGYDFGVAIGCGCGGGTMGGWVGACFIGDCSGGFSHVLAHEFNHQVAGIGDVYSYRRCDWDVPYCEYGDRTENCPEEYRGKRACEVWCANNPSALSGCPSSLQGQSGCAAWFWDTTDRTAGDCPAWIDELDACQVWCELNPCPRAFGQSQCEYWCEDIQGGDELYGCPDSRNVIPAADGFWVNRWIPISSQTSAYIMDSCIQSGSCTWTWMRLEDVRNCIDTDECGHRLPDDTIVWGDMGNSNSADGIRNDGYLNLLVSTRFRSESDPEALLMSGTISINGTAILDPFIYLPDAALDILPGLEGDYYLFLLDENGSVLSTSGFEVRFYQTDPDGGPLDEVPFVYRIEWKEGTKRIELQDKDGSVLASREVSPNKPEIRVLYPNGGEVFAINETIEIRWQASDEDGDALTYSLAMSLDSGETWLPIDIDIMDNEYEMSTEALEEGQNYLIKVRATDGVNTSEDVSDGAFNITAEGKAEEGGINTWVIIVIVIVAIAVVGLVVYLGTRRKKT